MVIRTYLQTNFQASLWKGKKGIPADFDIVHDLENVRNAFLWDVFSSFSANCIVEIGSGLGANIIGYAKLNPEIKLIGLDLNPTAISRGRQAAESLELQNITFHQFDITETSVLEVSQEKSTTVVLSRATLIYVHPFKILRALRNIIDPDMLGFVIIEQHSDQLPWLWKHGKVIAKGPNYIRDYLYLLNKIGITKHFSIEVQPLGQDVWSPGGGNAFMISGRNLKKV